MQMCTVWELGNSIVKTQAVKITCIRRLATQAHPSMFPKEIKALLMMLLRDLIQNSYSYTNHVSLPYHLFYPKIHIDLTYFLIYCSIQLILRWRVEDICDWIFQTVQTMQDLSSCNNIWRLEKDCPEEQGILEYSS